MLQMTWKDPIHSPWTHRVGWSIVALLSLVLSFELLRKHTSLHVTPPEFHWGNDSDSRDPRPWRGYANLSNIFALYVLNRGHVSVVLRVACEIPSGRQAC